MKRILILRAGLIGDTIWATTLTDGIKRILKWDCHIDWVTKTLGHQLFEYDPHVNHIFTLEHRHRAHWLSKHKRDIIRHSKQNPYDYIINAETADFFIPFIKKIQAKTIIGAPHHLPRETTHAVRFCHYLLSQLTQHENIVDAKPTLYPSPTIDSRWQLSSPYIVIVPTNSASHKKRSNFRQWPLQHWKVLLEQLNTQQQSVVLLGAPEDKKIIPLLGSLPRHCHNWIGQTRLADSFHIIQHASLMITTDTGSAHMAAALDTPLLALYGPTDRKITGPYYTDPGKLRLLSFRVNNGCLPFLPKKPQEQLLLDITPEMVLPHINELLANNKPLTQHNRI